MNTIYQATRAVEDAALVEAGSRAAQKTLVKLIQTLNLSIETFDQRIEVVSIHHAEAGLFNHVPGSWARFAAAPDCRLRQPPP